jgi:hypothetical protein
MKGIFDDMQATMNKPLTDEQRKANREAWGRCEPDRANTMP